MNSDSINNNNLADASINNNLADASINNNLATIAIVNRNTCMIETFYEDIAPNQAKYGGSWGWAHETIHLQVPSDLDKSIINVVNRDGAYIFEIDPIKQAQKLETQWTQLRNERNKRLADSDWTQLSDITFNDSDRDAWKLYRLSLRILPSITLDPSNPIWPLKPTEVAVVEPV